MIKKLIIFITTICLTLSAAAPAYAATTSSGSKCGDTQTQLIACDSKTGVGTINNLISITISILTVVIGIVATGALAYAGIIYASAQDDQSMVSEARGLIRNVVIGLLLYGLTIAIINWLIPNSVISGGGSADNTQGGAASSQQTTSPSPSPSTASQGTVTPGT